MKYMFLLSYFPICKFNSSQRLWSICHEQKRRKVGKIGKRVFFKSNDYEINITKLSVSHCYFKYPGKPRIVIFVSSMDSYFPRLFLNEKLLEVNFLLFQFISELSIILDSLHWCNEKLIAIFNHY